ncbi:hypothetical protein [Legionella cherrii]|uniref:Fir n=1 Tax=Legionella cherrii TaxID=28084 RepID=A0A0W0SG23_9GAMM|nr:hypothetical protein [Legionella cherrii]KTC82359.1 hypothetical protein Lche_0623 [Legionella cherrii]VEB32512.1 Uncharacterised protein [Legionella cherrii]
MGFFKHESGDGELKTQIDNLKEPINKMAAVMAGSGRDIGPLQEGTKILDIITQVITNGPDALPKEALNNQEAQQQTPGAKEQLQALKQKSEESTQEEKVIQERSLGLGS